MSKIKVPRTLPKEARKVFKNTMIAIQDQIDVNNPMVCDMIVNYSISKYMIIKVQNDLNKLELTESDKAHGGQQKKNPLNTIIKQHQDQMLKIFNALKIDTKPKDPLDDDPMNDLIGDKR